MKISKRQLRRIIREEAEGLLDVAEPSEVEPIEGIWAGGEGQLVDPIDFVAVDTDGSVTNVAEPEMINITGTKEPEVLNVAALIERLHQRIRLKKLIKEQAVAVEEELPGAEVVAEPVPVVEPEVEERAGASASALRGWLSGKAAEVNDLGISDPQIPALIAAMNDLIGQAQAGTLSSREDRVRKGIAKA
jgi:hypothetical protein